MKTLTCLFLFSMCLVGFGQTSEELPLFHKRKPGIMRFYTGLHAPTEITPSKFDRFNTDIFFNSWTGEVDEVKTHFYSLGHNINMMFDIPFSKTSRFGVAIGLGYSHFSVRHDGAFNFIDDPDLLKDEMYSSFANYTGDKRWVNRTAFNLVEVPFELRIRSLKERGKWKFYPGFKVSFMVDSYSKWRIENQEFKVFNFPDLNRLHYGPSLRLGRDNIFLFGYYDMTYLFTNENSNKLQLFAAGISIGWF